MFVVICITISCTTLYQTELPVMASVPPGGLILVTGANGYVASVANKVFVERDYHVRWYCPLHRPQYLDGGMSAPNLNLLRCLTLILRIPSMEF